MNTIRQLFRGAVSYNTVYPIFVRNIGITYPMYQKSKDPIQQLFLEKITEVGTLLKSGGLENLSKDANKQLFARIEKLKVQFGVKDGDFTAFTVPQYPESIKLEDKFCGIDPESLKEDVGEEGEMAQEESEGGDISEFETTVDDLPWYKSGVNPVN